MKTRHVSEGMSVMAVIFLFVCTALMLGSGPAWTAPAGSRWGADYFPNIPLVTQNGNIEA